MTKLRYIEPPFGKTGISLIRKYANTLQIRFTDAYDIIMSNKAARLYLEQETVLKLTSSNKVLGTILRATLLREVTNFNPITPSEKAFIQNNYNIKLSPNIPDIHQIISLYTRTNSSLNVSTSNNRKSGPVIINRYTNLAKFPSKSPHKFLIYKEAFNVSSENKSLSTNLTFSNNIKSSNK